MWFISILAACVLGAIAQQVSVAAPPFTLVDETLSVAYGNVSVSPPGRVLPLNGKLALLYIVHISYSPSNAVSTTLG